jgi:hypothetical protein
MARPHISQAFSNHAHSSWYSGGFGHSRLTLMALPQCLQDLSYHLASRLALQDLQTLGGWSHSRFTRIEAPQSAQ